MKRTKTRLLLLVMFSVLLLTGAAFGTGAGSEPTKAPLKVDLDLSGLSGTFVYSQVYNMMYDPDAYLGNYSAFEDPERGVVYHACIIPDATACCAQGIEFIWDGEHAWPEDYPEEGADIVVTGRLEAYEEDGYLYLHLVDAELVFEQPEQP